MSASTGEGAAEAERQLSRRDVLKAGVAGAATAATVGSGIAEAAAARAYPRLRIVELAELERNRPVPFAYPLAKQPNVLIDFGRAVPAGVGPRASIVAYSILCQHMGCPVEYERDAREFYCPCHQSRYDPERLGSIIQGVTARALPRVQLRVRDGAVWAVGIDGLIFATATTLPRASPLEVDRERPKGQRRAPEPKAGRRGLPHRSGSGRRARSASDR